MPGPACLGHPYNPLESADRIDREFFTDTYRLKVRSKKRGDTDFVPAVVRIAGDLIEDCLHVKHVVALDVIEAGGPAIVRRRISSASVESECVAT